MKALKMDDTTLFAAIVALLLILFLLATSTDLMGMLGCSEQDGIAYVVCMLQENF